MSLEIKPGTKVILYLKSYAGPTRRSGTIIHVSAVSIVLKLDKFNTEGDNVLTSRNYNYLFSDIVEIYQQ